MAETTEEAVLLALESRTELFESMEEILSSDNYLRVLMALEEGMTQTEIAESLDVGTATVSRAIQELLEYQLVDETENGYRKTFPVLDHPMIQYYYRKEVLDNG